MQRIQLSLGDHMMLVFRHFPLIELHPHAELAAEAVEFAGAQGKFWAMHDMVFESQSDLSERTLPAYVLIPLVPIPGLSRQI